MRDTMHICPTCGVIDDKAAARDGLIVHVEPLRVSFRGVWIALTPLQAEIMAKLVRFGSAPTAELQSYGGAESLRVTIHHMRKRLPRPVRVEAIYGWGYRLRVSGGSRYAGRRALEATELEPTRSDRIGLG